jgi:hypothetical protein
MRKLVVALAAGAIGIGVIASPAAARPTGGPGEPTCQAAIISTSVQEFGGRRAVATEFFPEVGPQAVQAAQRTVQGFCASP